MDVDGEPEPHMEAYATRMLDTLEEHMQGSTEAPHSVLEEAWHDGWTNTFESLCDTYLVRKPLTARAERKAL